MWSDEKIRYAIERIYEACANYDKQKEKEYREFHITNDAVSVAFRNAYAKFSGVNSNKKRLDSLQKNRSRNANGEM